jgi:hypothetical protein
MVPYATGKAKLSGLFNCIRVADLTVNASKYFAFPVGHIVQM